MTRRPCLECGARIKAGSRCPACEAQHQRRRNARAERREYRTAAYQRASLEARRRQPWCSLCGRLEDLTWDHEHSQVECRSCNSSHRRNRAT